MKKRITMLLLATTMMFGSMSAVTVYADEKDDRIAELEAQVEDLQKQLEEALAKIPVATNQEEYKIGETWVVDGLWSVTINSVEETQERNEYSEKNPAAVYIITYTYENLGYQEEDGSGLQMWMEDGIVDAEGFMGYSYPGDYEYYCSETPIGAKCKAQSCIGVDNAGSFKIHFSDYDTEYNEIRTVFAVDVE